MIDSRRTVVTATFALCCLLSSARLVVDAPTPRSLKVFPDVVAKRSDLRFSALKSMLPSRGVIGYIGEPGTAGLADYYLTQYALAPLVLDRSSKHPIVVGNFPGSLPSAASFNGLHLERDFGNGVLLFTTEDAN